jgi:hypothetical protein
MSGMDMPKPASTLSSSLTVTVDGKTTKFSVAKLKAMPQQTVQVHNEHTKTDEQYSGPALSDVLAKCGFVADKATQKKMLHSYVVAGGTDKYWVVYSATEVEGSEHAGSVIVATMMGSPASDKGLGADGELKLVSTEDKKPQRWVRNLTSIELKTAE